MSFDQTIRLDLPASYQYLSVVSVVLAELLQKVDPLPDREQTIYNAQLAAQEVCVNVVRHAYAGMTGGRIQIDITLAESPLGLRICLFDQGQWFDPATAPPPDLENPQVHGYGLFLLRQIMDEVHYEHREGRNCWQLVKYLYKD